MVKKFAYFEGVSKVQISSPEKKDKENYIFFSTKKSSSDKEKEKEKSSDQVSIKYVIKI